MYRGGPNSGHMPRYRTECMRWLPLMDAEIIYLTSRILQQRAFGGTAFEGAHAHGSLYWCTGEEVISLGTLHTFQPPDAHLTLLSIRHTWYTRSLRSVYCSTLLSPVKSQKNHYYCIHTTDTKDYRYMLKAKPMCQFRLPANAQPGFKLHKQTKSTSGNFKLHEQTAHPGRKLLILPLHIYIWVWRTTV